MTDRALPRQLKLVVLWAARLALFAFIFQTTAIDHWHRDPSQLEGIPGTRLHASHCHIEAGSCADSAGTVGSLTDVALTPIPPAPLVSAAPAAEVAQPESPLLLTDKPPRAA
jgi:hypothetical protein